MMVISGVALQSDLKYRCPISITTLLGIINLSDLWFFTLINKEQGLLVLFYHSISVNKSAKTNYLLYYVLRILMIIIRIILT